MNSQERIEFQETSRDFRTEIPNIVLEMLHDGDIDPSSFTLYCVYRRIAGQSGACWVGTRELAKRCGLSTKTITNCKRVLSQSFKKLDGNKLIRITASSKKSEQADIVTIMDIWPYNHAFFQKKPTCGKRDHRGVVKETTEEGTLKKEPFSNPPLSSPPKKQGAKEIKSLRSEEEDSFIDDILKDTVLSPKEKLRVKLTSYSKEVIARAVSIARTQPVKKSFMGLLLNILDNPDNWTEKPKEQQLTTNQQLALQYNERLRDSRPNLARENDGLIPNECLRIYNKFGLQNISLKTAYTREDLREATNYLITQDNKK